MRASANRIRAKTPLHLWIVATLGVLWNGFGCYDFVMTNVRHQTYIAQFPPDLVDYFDALPAWAIVAWGVGVWGALLGSLLLLLRSIWAAYAFALSLLGLALMQFYQLAVGVPDSMRTPTNLAMTAVIWLVAVGLLFYALRMRSRTVLV